MKLAIAVRGVHKFFEGRVGEVHVKDVFHKTVRFFLAGR